MLLKKGKKSFKLSISFETVFLPPFKDIMLLGKKCPHGKTGVSKSLSLLAPNSFDLIELHDDKVEAMLINRQLLNRMSEKRIIQILKENVFPHVLDDEIIKVDFDLKILISDIEGTFE